jgi:hypothetical protein
MFYELQVIEEEDVLAYLNVLILIRLSNMYKMSEVSVQVVPLPTLEPGTSRIELGAFPLLLGWKDILQAIK